MQTHSKQFLFCLIMIVISIFLGCGDKTGDEDTSSQLKTNLILQTGTVEYDTAKKIKLDSDGNLLIAGRTHGRFDGSNLAHKKFTAFLMKISPQGKIHWKTQWGDEYSSEIFSMTVDDKNNSYIAGYEGSDAFLTKFNSSGDQKWNKFLGGKHFEMALATAHDKNHDIYMVSSCSYVTDDLDSTVPEDCSPNSLSKWDRDGNLIWKRDINVYCFEEYCSLQIDDENNIIVVGSWKHPKDPVVTKLSQDGEILWQTDWGSEDDDIAFSITLDNKNNIYAAGFAKGALSLESQSGYMDSFITKLSSSGKIIWTKQWGTDHNQEIKDITFGKDGYIYAAGRKTTRFDAENNAFRSNLFVSCFNTDGDKQWEKSWESEYESSGNSIVQSKDSAIYVTGYTSGSFEGEKSLGMEDIFVIKFYPDGKRCRHFKSCGR